MKTSIKKFFALGLGLAAAGVAVGFALKSKKKVEKAINELVKIGKLSKEEGEALAKEIHTELKKTETKFANIKKKSKSKTKRKK